jgi:hypothetical protein
MNTSPDKINIFIDILFFYFIKREPTDSEKEIHTKRFYNEHKKEFSSIKSEFCKCEESKKSTKKKYDEFIDINTLDTQKIYSYIIFLAYCISDNFIEGPKLLEYYKYMSNYKENKLSHLANYLQNFPRNYLYKNDSFSLIDNNTNYDISISEAIYNIKYDAHSGHVFAYFIMFMEYYKDEDYIISITNKYYQKHKHIIEFYELVKGKDKVIRLEENKVYNINLKQLHPNLNFTDVNQKLFMTKDFLKTNSVFLRDVYINKSKLILSNPDRKSLVYSEHMHLIHKCINVCLEKHKNEKFYNNIFLVKNNKKTPFNNTPARGFNLDFTQDFLNKYNFVEIDPQTYELSKLVYLLSKAKNIITSWSTILYINKFFFNKGSTVLVLCHRKYYEEYSNPEHKKNIYFADCRNLYYMIDLDTNSLNNHMLEDIMPIFSINSS